MDIDEEIETYIVKSTYKSLTFTFNESGKRSSYGFFFFESQSLTKCLTFFIKPNNE